MHKHYESTELEIEWNVANKIAFFISILSLFVGLVFTNIDGVRIIIGSVIPMFMLIVPRYLTWFMPRKYFSQEPPKEYVIVFGWAGLLYNSIHIVWSLMKP